MKGINLLLAFVGGAAAGIAIGVLMAPEKGEDTRKKIQDFTADKAKETKEKIKEAKDKLREILDSKGIKLDCNELNKIVDETLAD